MIVTAARTIIPTAKRAITNASSASILIQLGPIVLLKGCESSIHISVPGEGRASQSSGRKLSPFLLATISVPKRGVSSHEDPVTKSLCLL
jgi:hypothetical protein